MVRIVERMETMSVKGRKKQWLGIFLMLALLTSGTVYARNNTRQEEVQAGRVSTDQMSEDIAEIIDRGKLRIAIPSEDLEAFFETDEDGKLSGIDIELAEGIAASLGVEAEFDRSSKNYDELTERLKNGDVDLVIATFSHSLDRIRYIDFSNSYLQLRFGLMVNKQAMVTRGLEGSPVTYLKGNGERIAAVQGTSHVKMAEQLFDVCEIVETKNYDEAVELVKAGEVFGFFCGELEFYSQYLAQPTLRIYTDTYVFSDVRDEFCVGIPLGHEQLLDYVNLYLTTYGRLTVADVQERYLLQKGGL